MSFTGQRTIRVSLARPGLAHSGASGSAAATRVTDNQIGQVGHVFVKVEVGRRNVDLAFISSGMRAPMAQPA